MSDTDGTATGADNWGASTQDDTTAAAGETKFTDADMAAARASWEAKAKRNAGKALTTREREILDDLDADSFEEIKEALTGKRQEQTDLEAQHADMKKSLRASKRDLEAYGDLQARHAALQARVNDAAKRDAVYVIAKEANAHEDLVMLKIASQLDVDEDGKVFVIGDDGDPAGKTVETAIKEMVAKDQRLLRAVDGAGGGSGPPAGAPQSQRGGSPADWKQKIAAATKDTASVHNPYGTTTINPFAK